MPAAEHTIDEALIRALLRTQGATIPDAAGLPLRLLTTGWDNELWRLGDEYVVRLPRRAIAAPLVRHEHRWLPEVAARVEPTGVHVPVPLVCGEPGEGYPWPWTVAAWTDGDAALTVPRGIRSSWAVPLAHALRALHTPAPPDHPVNPFRGVPLAVRADRFAERLASLRARPDADGARLDAAADAWRDALAAEPWNRAPVWIHGDLHPGNLVAQGRTLRAIIDFGDITAGDPAYDLAIGWLAFDAEGRAAFVDELADVDAATWRRARGWAAAVTLILLDASDDNPAYLALGRECLAEFS